MTRQDALWQHGPHEFSARCSKISDAKSLCVRLSSYDGMRDTGVGGGNVQEDAKELSTLAAI